MKKKKILKSAFKNIISQLEINIKDSWYYKLTDEYFIFSPFDKNCSCQTIGIDIGTKHLGIAGLSKVDNRKYPIWTWCSLISVPNKTLHESVDRLVDIIYKSKDFEWFRNADYFRIELQMQINPKARAVSCVLRALSKIFQIQNNKPIDVEFVHGNLKYSFAPLYSKKSKNDPLRELLLSGQSNTKKRKILGKNDTENLLKLNGEKNMLKFLNLFSNYVDQLFDMTDAYLIARIKYEK